MVLKIKYNNKLVISAMLKQYAKLYFLRFCDWFDALGGIKQPTS